MSRPSGRSSSQIREVKVTKNYITHPMGSAFTINWSFKNGIYTPGQCHIKLFNGNTEVSSLQNWAINDGVYTWYVSSSLSNSDCYNIRIIHTSNSSIYVIGSYFTIQ